MCEQGCSPCGRRNHACEAVGAITVVISGGFDGSRMLHDVFVFNIKHETWIEIKIQGVAVVFS